MTAAITTIGLWASAFVVIRGVAAEISPPALVLGRLLTGTAALWLLTVRSAAARRRPAGRDILALGFLGIAGFAAYGIALTTGERTVDPGTASLIINTVPLWVALLGLLARERISRSLAAGLCTGYAGAALIVTGEFSGHAANTRGALLILAAALCQATQFVLQRPLAARLGAVTVTLWSMTVPLAVLAPAAPALIHAAERDPVHITAAVLYLGLGPTALGYTCWSYALGHGSTAARSASLLYAVPVVTIAISWPVLGERPTLLTCAGGAIAMAGTILSRGKLGGRRSAVASQTEPTAPGSQEPRRAEETSS